MLDDQEAVAFQMNAKGQVKVLGQVDDWPVFTSEVQAYLRVWFKHNLGKPHQIREFENIVSPTDGGYPQVLARALTHDDYLQFWAYVTQPVLVHPSQIAQAMGISNKGPDLREVLREQGLAFARNEHGHYVCPLDHVEEKLPDVAARILLYPRQIGAFLGLSNEAAGRQAKKLGIALTGRPGAVVAPWGDVSRLRRTGPRTVDMLKGQK